MTIFNQKNIDYTKQPMFFGELLNSQRFDKFKYPKFYYLMNRCFHFFGDHKKYLFKDRNDYKMLPPHQQHIFTSNLKFQTLLDSVQGRGPVMAFLPIISLPELEGAVITWDFFEGSIHSKSYSYIMQNIYSDPTKIFDEIIDNQDIMKRAVSVSRYYDNFINMLNIHKMKIFVNDPSMVLSMQGNGFNEKLKEALKPILKSFNQYELKKSLYMALINVNIFEAITINFMYLLRVPLLWENKLMEGSAKILSSIDSKR